MVEFNEDRVVPTRPAPDRDLVARAHNLMIEEQTELERYVRQQWEVALSSTKVALDAWRRVWPIESDALPRREWGDARRAEHALVNAYHSLDVLSESLQGRLMHLAERGLLSEQMVAQAEEARALIPRGRPTTTGVSSWMEHRGQD